MCLENIPARVRVGWSDASIVVNPEMCEGATFVDFPICVEILCCLFYTPLRCQYCITIFKSDKTSVGLYVRLDVLFLCYF